jgi:hypothetical protein
MNALYDQVIEFIHELSNMYPNDPDFPLFLTTTRLLRTTNPSLLPKNIFEMTFPYTERIMARDEKFFIEQDFSVVETYDINLLTKIKEYVSTMTPESKQHVWAYIHNITRLSKVLN